MLEAVTPWLPWLIAAWVGAYFLVLGFLSLGVARLPRSERLPDARCTRITVLVSARNEARDLPACVASLVALDYPRDLLEIILVDDFSTDATGPLIDAAAAAHPEIVALHSADFTDNGLEAKARGIAHGFTRATGDWVLITDADATVHPQWARHLLGRLSPETGMVGGALVVRPDGWFGTIERVSWGFLQLFNNGMAGWGVPFVCLGPNMAIRRDVYAAAGGLERASFKVAEDLALFQMVQRRGLRAQVYMDAETAVTLSPVPSPAHLLSQHRRWLAGGIGQGWLYALSLGSVTVWAYGMVAYILLGWMLGWKVWVAFTIAKACIDAGVLRVQQARLGLTAHARYWWVLQLYHIALVTLLPSSFLFTRRIAWKGDGYAVEYT